MLFLRELSISDFGNHVHVNRKVRNELLDFLLIYYKLHIDGFGEMKSLQVLRELLD